MLPGRRPALQGSAGGTGVDAPNPSLPGKSILSPVYDGESVLSPIGAWNQ